MGESELWRRTLPALIYGHHGGMPSPTEAMENATRELSKEAMAELQRRAENADSRLAEPAPSTESVPALAKCQTKQELEMLLRFVFSCLTDADGLDTERHLQKDRSEARKREYSLAPLLETLLADQERLAENSESTPVNEVRKAVYNECLHAASLPPGVFSLTVPTGGGKTRSSLAFALSHAVRHGLRRVIYAIPYTSIVDQTVKVFREIFGDVAPILEHHSAIDPRVQETEGGQGGERELWRRLAAENWDAPIIVTTTVQLFESLFSNRPGRCRKLHNIAGSVIVLDEVQTLPPPLLSPLLDGLKTLVRNFNVTVVLCTATQPAFDLDSPYLKGFSPAPTPIIGDAAANFQTLRRVTYMVKPDPWTWEQVAKSMRSHKRSCLAVVNTKKDAQALLDILGEDENVRHLSTLLCGRHRKDVLAEVTAWLEEERHGRKPPLLLVSTQVVEAGVDLDFPVVMRALGPLDRMIQVAGRCNREGLRPCEDSLVIIFRPVEGSLPRGVYETAVDLTWTMLRRAQIEGKPLDFDDPELATEYFRKLYGAMQRQLDARGVQQDREYLRFPDVAKKVRLIDDDTVPVLITNYAGTDGSAAGVADRIIADARDLKRMTRQLWQQAQPLCVAIYRTEFKKRPDLVEAIIDGEEDGLYIWRGDYDVIRGIAPSVARDPADFLAG